MCTGHTTDGSKDLKAGLVLPGYWSSDSVKDMLIDSNSVNTVIDIESFSKSNENDSVVCNDKVNDMKVNRMTRVSDNIANFCHKRNVSNDMQHHLVSFKFNPTKSSDNDMNCHITSRLKSLCSNGIICERELPKSDQAKPSLVDTLKPRLSSGLPNSDQAKPSLVNACEDLCSATR